MVGTLALIAAIVFAVGSFYIIRIAPARSEVDASFLRAYKFIFSRYRTDRYYFNGFFLARNLLIAVMPVLNPDDAQVGAMATLIVSLFFLVVQVRVWPWRLEDINYLDTVVLSAMVVILAAGMCLVPGAPDTVVALHAILIAASMQVGVITTVILRHVVLMLIHKGDIPLDNKLRKMTEQMAVDWQRMCKVLATCKSSEHQDIFLEWSDHDIKVFHSVMCFLEGNYSVQKLQSTRSSSFAGKRITLEPSAQARATQRRVSTVSITSSQGQHLTDMIAKLEINTAPESSSESGSASQRSADVAAVPDVDPAAVGLLQTSPKSAGKHSPSNRSNGTPKSGGLPSVSDMANTLAAGLRSPKEMIGTPKKLFHREDVPVVQL